MTERQGLFQGDLNLVQRAALQWIMNNEIEELIEIERYRIESHALASNPATSTEYLKHLFKPEMPTPQDMVPTAPMDTDWITPESVAEVEDFLQGSLSA